MTLPDIVLLCHFDLRVIQNDVAYAVLFEENLLFALGILFSQKKKTGRFCVITKEQGNVQRFYGFLLSLCYRCEGKELTVNRAFPSIPCSWA